MSFGLPIFTGSAKYSRENTNQYGTTTPVLSDAYKNAFDAYKNGLGANGANALQQAGLDIMARSVRDMPVQTSAAILNNDLMGMRGDLADLNQKYAPYTTQAAPQLGTAQQAVAQTGANYMGAYSNPYDRDVIDTSLADYDAGWDRSLNTQRAGRDASGAFGDRAAIADAVFNADATRGRGTLASNLRQQGFNTAAGLGQTDADRAYNASALNANIQNQRDMTNLSATQANQQQQLQAINAQQQNIAAQSGISQQILQNVITNNGVNMDAAQAYLNAGMLTQGQLAQLADLASAGNGSSFTNNTTGNSFSVSVGGGRG